MSGTLFPTGRVILPNGDMAPNWRYFLQNLYRATGGGLTSIPASSIAFTPTGSVTAADTQTAVAQLDSQKVAGTTTVNGHPLSANVTLTASDVGAMSGTGTANLAGVLTTLGAFASTFTMTGVTTVTFPTSGTLATVNATMAGGGAVTQATSKSTGVTLNSATGRITTNSAALAANTTVTFSLTNNTIAATDIVATQLQSGNAGAGTYQVWAEASAAGSVQINVQNITAGSLSEALVISYAVVKSVTA